MDNFWDTHLDKLLLAGLIIFFGSLGVRFAFAAKECDTLVGGFSVLLVQRFSKGATP